MKIYLLKNCETDYNREGRIEGRINLELNKNGIRQAQELREKLKDYKIDVCFTSSLIRAMETAFTIVGDRCLIIKDDRLIERDIGVLEGKLKKECDITKYNDLNTNIGEDGVKRIKDVYKRVEDFISDLKKDYKNKNVLIVSHSMIVRVIRNILSNKLDDSSFDNNYIEEFDI